MKKHLLLLSNLIIIFSIVIGFTGVVYRDTAAYQDIAEKHLEHILKLADKDISSHIDDYMTKPVMVSKTMANDEFLKRWFYQEPEKIGNQAYMEQLYNYLGAYQKKYGYSTVFCISAQTQNYYYQKGLYKTISSKIDHDQWYYDFIESGHEHDLEVGVNETDDEKITIFVNFRVEGRDGTLLGVIGVGLEVDTLDDLIYSYEKEYGLSAYIINDLKSPAFSDDIDDIFISKDELQKRTGIIKNISLNKSEAPEMQWHTFNGERKCLITKYNKTLGWYLVLEMDTDSISRVFEDSIRSNVAFMLAVLAACIVVSTFVFVNYNQHIIKLENIDELTGLANRKQFTKLYSAFLRKNRKRKKTLFMLDVDHFKEINDTYGHMFGNAVLAMVGEDLRNAVKPYGIAARWGGDEFFGILLAEPDEAKQIIAAFMDSLRSEEKRESYQVTISVGISEVDEELSMEQMVKRVDEALYRSKENGRNQISIS